VIHVVDDVRGGQKDFSLPVNLFKYNIYFFWKKYSLMHSYIF
jgi:hypothetical protein